MATTRVFARLRQRRAQGINTFAAACFVASSLLGFIAAAGAAPATNAVMQVRDYEFTTKSLTVGAGDNVVFHNSGQAVHRIVADDGSFDSHGLQPGQDFSVTFASVGTFMIHCAIHPSMTAQIVVLAHSPTTVAATATTKPARPANLAETGAATMPLTFIAALLIAAGFAVLLGDRRAKSALAGVPSEAVYRRVTLLQRHLDDVLPPRAAPRARARARRRR